MRSLVCERIALHAVDAEDSDAPLLQIRAEGADHALTFLLPLVAAARREGEDGRAVIAVNGDAHVPIETVRVPTLMVTMHAVRGYRVDGRPQARFQRSRAPRTRSEHAMESPASFSISEFVSRNYPTADSMNEVRMERVG